MDAETINNVLEEASCSMLNQFFFSLFLLTTYDVVIGGKWKHFPVSCRDNMCHGATDVSKTSGNFFIVSNIIALESKNIDTLARNLSNYCFDAVGRE